MQEGPSWSPTGQSTALVLISCHIRPTVHSSVPPTVYHSVGHYKATYSPPVARVFFVFLVSLVSPSIGPFIRLRGGVNVYSVCTCSSVSGTSTWLSPIVDETVTPRFTPDHSPTLCGTDRISWQISPWCHLALRLCYFDYYSAFYRATTKPPTVVVQLNLVTTVHSRT